MDGEVIYKNGYPYCKKCGTARFIIIGGTVFPCLCECQAKERDKENARKDEEERRKIFTYKQIKSGVSERYRDVTFENTKHFSEVNGAYESMQNYCKNADAVKANNIWVYIYGENSTGKTHLTACMANHLISKGYNVLFTSVPQIIADIQSSYTRNTATQAEILKDLATKDFVFLDDLGKEITGTKTAFSEKILLEVINARYNNKLPTIITSNYSIKELGTKLNVDAAITQRLGEECKKIIKMQGLNFRKVLHDDKSEILKKLGI